VARIIPSSRLPPATHLTVRKPRDAVAFRQSLLKLLESDPPHEERLLAGLERRRGAGPLYSSLLYILTHLTFTEAEARRHWKRVVAHRDLLRQTLGRDLGLRVALLDYFVNVNRELRNPKVIEISIYERTERSALTDGLTGLYNHAYFLQALRREVQRARRHRSSLSVVLLDLDDFKRVNDSRGHVEGDRVLLKAAALVRDSVREIDVAARYGGEEFAVILTETDRDGAHLVAERIRRRIEEHFRRARAEPPVTISGGVATWPDNAAGAEELLRRADEGLYRAKAAGKNCIALVAGERRRYARVPAHYPLTLSASGERASARSKNVSEGGLLVNLKEPVPLGSKVTLVIRPPRGAVVGLRGEVVRVEAVKGGYDLGVRFLNNRSRGALALRRLSGV
jgi:diguanylate cyclase (GGDEF)-like protein